MYVKNEKIQVLVHVFLRKRRDVWHRLTHHFLSGETTCPLGFIHKSVSAPRCHTRHWIYLKTAEMRFLDWIPYEKSFQNWNNKQQKKSKSDSCEDVYNSSEHAPPLRRAGHAWTAMVHGIFISCYQPGECGDSIHSEF